MNSGVNRARSSVKDRDFLPLKSIAILPTCRYNVGID